MHEKYLNWLDSNGQWVTGVIGLGIGLGLFVVAPVLTIAWIISL